MSTHQVSVGPSPPSQVSSSFRAKGEYCLILETFAGRIPASMTTGNRKQVNDMKLIWSQST